MKLTHIVRFASAIFAVWSLNSCSSHEPLTLENGAHISLVGNNLCSRMMNYGSFETEMHLRYPEKELYIRNFCDGGDTPGFRPHSGRNEPWAFPGAEKFQDSLAIVTKSVGHLASHDEWLANHKTDIILAFFGYSESQEGAARLENWKAELSAWIEHTQSQQYNGTNAPQIALVSPIAFQDLSDKYDLPNGETTNENLKIYAKGMAEVAKKYSLLFVDAFSESKGWYNSGQLTIDGLQFNEEGYTKFADLLADEVFGSKGSSIEARRTEINELVNEKNWFWHNDFKIPNGVHVFGRRHEPFGTENYPDELIKVRQMTAIRDTVIWKNLAGESYDYKAADALTQSLSPVETNFKLGNSINYIYGEEAMNKFTVAPGFKMELFASEEDFPDLANPSQVSFDNKGRLWVACMPTYPHYKPGDSKPNDKLIILEDTDGDYKADKLTVFADNLHIPAGFEFAPEGVYISQGTNLKLFTDTDNDDKADKEEIILSGFDDHDTHHVISAFCADPSGAFVMGEGVFLHTSVETPYGTMRSANGGFYRYNPARKHLERLASQPIPNPWGTAFDKWGQPFYAETSGPNVNWMTPGTSKANYGEYAPKSPSLVEEEHRVRPTSGLEFVSSRHFPDNMQGDMMINNTIGFLGMKVHKMMDDGTGYKSEHHMDLIKSSDPNFRPVDMEFAPDGSLYLADWHNVLIGHMQHNARDPLRDHVHGKIYRITYPSRPLVEAAQVDGASIETLLDNLKLPEYRTKYRTRRELRERDTEEVYNTVQTWVSNLDKGDPNYEQYIMEAMWVTWGLNKINPELLKNVLKAKDFRVRAAGVKTLRYVGHQIPYQEELLSEMANDEHGRVRLEALIAATWLPNNEKASAVLANFAKHPIDKWMAPNYAAANKNINGVTDEKVTEKKEKVSEMMALGKAVYIRDGHCATCHQENGKGLEASGFPPLGGTKWVMGNKERLIKVVLNGLYGPVEVMGKKYPGNVPMTPFGGMLDDNEIAAVTNYVRNSFGNTSSDSPITPELVKKVREATKNKEGFWTQEELVKDHPLEDSERVK